MSAGPNDGDHVPALAYHDATRTLGSLYDVAIELRPAIELADDLQRAMFTDGEPGKWAGVLERLDGALADAGEVLA